MPRATPLVHAVLVAALVSGCGSSSPGESADPTGSSDPSTSASASGSSSPSPSESASPTEDETESGDPNAGTPFEGVKPAGGRKVEMTFGTFRLPPGWVSPEGGPAFKIPTDTVSGAGCRFQELANFDLTMEWLREGRHELMLHTRDLSDFIWGGNIVGHVVGRASVGRPHPMVQFFTIPVEGKSALVLSCAKVTPEPWRKSDQFAMLASWRWKQ